ncbi:MAG: citrate transporter [Firmicutes bacterium]|nr:citrate transporter [Bacillota bacterium]
MPALVGFIMIAIIIVALIKFKMLPITVFATLPFIAAAVLGFGVVDIFTMTAKGVISVLPTATLFVFSITYFGIMTDVGLFDRPIAWLTKHMKTSVFGIMVATILISIVGHLDGSGTTTLMIAVPAIFPIVEKLKIRKLPVAFMLTMTIAVMNLLPWGGPMGRAAVVLSMDVTDLWKQILPVQIFGIVVLFVFAWFLAKSEEKRGFAAQPYDGDISGTEAKERELARPKLFWFNLILTVIVIALLFFGCPAFLPFMIGVAIALPVNYGKNGDTAMTARIKAHAGNVVPMILTIMGAGIFLGVLNNAGIISAMASTIVSVFPKALGRFADVIFGIFSYPLAIIFDADSMVLGLVPFIAEVGEAYGVPQINTVLAMTVGYDMGVGLCVTGAAVYFGCGLMGIEYRDSLKYSFFKAMIFSVALVVFGVIIGAF